MKKINKVLACQLLEEKVVGIYCDEGSCIGEDSEFVVVYDKLETYLAHISEFDVDGIFIRLKNEPK
jgi:hypothetical protein